ncbi:MAG: hypothetical protein HC878_06395 [Leptolyngbyaceae cyanobacterium SL_5_14]|nr:hypothetical protein [Leptolyngbyaceae cyanobacterium SL_5_14]
MNPIQETFLEMDWENVRPSVISTRSYTLLNALWAFRHFFRHAYRVPIDFI